MGANMSCLKQQGNDFNSTYDRTTVSTWMIETSEDVLINESSNNEKPSSAVEPNLAVDNPEKVLKNKIPCSKGKPTVKKAEPCYNPCYSKFKHTTYLIEPKRFYYTYGQQLLSEDNSINVRIKNIKIVQREETLISEIKNCTVFPIRISFHQNKSYKSVKEINVKANETVKVQHDCNTGIEVKSKYHEITQQHGIYCNLINYLEQDLVEESFTDLILTCKDRQIPCHKIILSARSPTFKKMIEEENFKGEIILDTMMFATLKAILKFMYTGKVLCDVDLPDLFVVAFEYQIPNLQQKCKLLMLETMNTVRVASVFHLAIKVQDDDLRTASMRYIIKNFEDVKLTEGWTILKQDSQAGQHLLDLLYSACSPLDTLAVLDLNKMKKSITEYGSVFSDLAKAFEGQSNADFILSCQDVEFNCQSLMLRRSPVFKAMLEKSTDGKLLIENETPEVLKAVLKFLHSAKIEVTSFFPDLHHAAKRYQINDLIRVSRELVSVSICNANTLQYFRFAVMNNDTTLRNEAMQYIREHFEVIKEMPEWTELKSYLRDTHCLEELISIVCSKKKTKSLATKAQ